MAAPAISSLVRAMRPRSLHNPSSYMRLCRPTKVQTSSNSSSVRYLSTSSSRRATVVAQNPRTDEDGHEMLINISERAAKRLKKITSTPAPRNTLVPSQESSPADSHLRITVTSGGCHGFQYLMSLESADKVDGEEDTVFAFEDDSKTGGIAKVVLDEPSLELLKGSTVDFTTELIGSQFKIVGNPRATSSCGCGTSFDIE